MSKVRQVARTPFGAAVIGGLVVGIFGWIAIAAGWVESQSTASEPPRSRAAPLPEPAAQQSSGKGLDGQPDLPDGRARRRLHPGPAGPEGPVAAQPLRRQRRWDRDRLRLRDRPRGPHPHQRPRRRRGAEDRGHARQHRQLPAGERSGGRQGPFDRRRAAQGRTPRPTSCIRSRSATPPGSASATRWSRSATRSGSTGPRPPGSSRRSSARSRRRTASRSTT